MESMKTAYRTDAGRVRTVNEDRVFVQNDWNGYTLAIVADGMGGHQAGDVASTMAVEGITERLKEIPGALTPDAREKAVREAIIYANDLIYDFAGKQIKFHGMGTTVVLALATEEELTVAHIGDSRAYLFHEGTLRQLTEDHSLVNELVRTGQIRADEAGRHPRRNVLTRALGTEPNAEPDILHFEWSPGDTLLLCSDGLSNLVHPVAMVGVLSLSSDAETLAHRLVQHALDAGGDDNITVALVANEPADAGGKGGDNG